MKSEQHPHNVCKFCPKCGSPQYKESGFKSQKCADCGFVFYTNSAAAVAAIILNEKGEVLLTRRAFEPAKGKLDLPGGFVDPLETAETALQREILEELNLEITSMKFFSTFCNEYVYGGLLYYTCDLVFICTIANMDAIQVADDVSAYEFHAITDEVIEWIGLPSIQQVLKAYKKTQLK